MNPEPVTFLMADDDPDDRLLAKDALHQSQMGVALRTVCDGEELLEYLRCEGRYGLSVNATRPVLVLLDMKMPRMDGLEALAIMKADADLRRIPVVILTTSRADEDVVRSYDLGVNAYVSKPVSFEELVRVLRTISEHWLHTATLAPR